MSIGPDTSIYEATVEALAAATHLTTTDKGAIAALKYLARKIDTEDDLRDMVLERAGEDNVKPPPLDNVSIPTYLKYCEALGLTPAARGAAASKGAAPAPEPEDELAEFSRKKKGRAG